MKRSTVSTLLWVLLSANLIFFVWAQGFLTPLGFGKADPREPQRLNHQIHPEAIVVLPAQSPSSAAPAQ